MTDNDGRPKATITVDLHCHSDASFDSRADAVAQVKRAALRGISHLAITDHGTIDGAMRARDARIEGVQVIVGEEVRTAMGDVIALFLERAIPNGLSLEETIAAIRQQHGIAGLPHPFDRQRPSVGERLDEHDMAELAGLVDYVEIRNGRLADGSARSRALEYAVAHGLPGVDASDAHTLVELGAVWTGFHGRAGSAEELRACLARQVGETLRLYEREPSARHGLRRVRNSVRSRGRRSEVSD